MDGEDKENKKKQTAPYTCDGRACPKTYSTETHEEMHFSKSRKGRERKRLFKR